ncbi:phage holin [Clostridium sp.]|uniref:phage holin n=1 Tax=Clostridium sp. TaxID=1506 RepID=UPI002638A513|nr:phage holin [Clostridium sp.]
MLTINLKSRFRNKAFILSMVGAIVLLIQQLGFKDIIPSNYAEIVNSILSILTMLGIIIDTSTPGISDNMVSNITVKAVNAASETQEAVKVEDSTTGINGDTTENSKSSDADAAVNPTDKESETNVNNQTVDISALQAERDCLKAQLDSIQSVFNGTTNNSTGATA